MTRRDPNDAAAAPGPTAYLIGRLDRALRRHLAEAVRPFGLTVPQYTALAVLRSRGELSNARLAERSFMTPQAANEMVKLMESRQWLSRQPDPTHGRIVLILLFVFRIVGLTFLLFDLIFIFTPLSKGHFQI